MLEDHMQCSLNNNMFYHILRQKYFNASPHYEKIPLRSFIFSYEYERIIQHSKVYI